MIAKINKIIYSSFVDGPGNRMAIFFQGCNLKCLYCHNPETQVDCNNCGMCLEECPTGALQQKKEKIYYNESLCKKCDRCISACKNFSTPKAVEMTTKEIIEIIEDARDFIDGVTFSGGECTLWSEFIIEVISKSRTTSDKKITYIIDTNGMIEKNKLLKICDVVDGVFLDIKELDKERHEKLTGSSNEMILDSMRCFSKKDLLLEIRMVIIEGFTDNEECVKKLAEMIKKMNGYTLLKLIRFRPDGVKTYLGNNKIFDKDRFIELYNVAYEILGNRVIV